MIGLLMSMGLGARAAKLVGYVIVPLLILGAIYFALDAYGDSRYREGRQVENQAWKDAQTELLKDAAAATTLADKKAHASTLEHTIKVQEEKEKIDEAIADGTSPLDVLFPTSGM